MDIFGDEESDSGEEDPFAIVNEVFLEMMKTKLQLKVKLDDGSDKEFILLKRICIVRNEEEPDVEKADHLCARLRAAKVSSVSLLTTTEFIMLSPATVFDIVVWLVPFTSMSASNGINTINQSLEVHVSPGGTTLAVGESWERLLPMAGWIMSSSKAKMTVMRKRCAKRNSTGALYWAREERGESGNVCGVKVEEPLGADLQEDLKSVTEAELLESVSVSVSVAEREAGVLCDSSHERAVKNILKYGVCIFPGLFNKKEILEWGAQAKADAAEIFDTLRRSKGVDILHPSSKSNPFINNFYELSMREALRCDIRNGPRVRKKSHDLYAAAKAAVKLPEPGAIPSPVIIPGTPVEATTARSFHVLRSAWAGGSRLVSAGAPIAVDSAELRSPTSSEWGAVCRGAVDPSCNLRYNPIILPIISEAMNPSSDNRMGNWGRWNFEGQGPDAEPSFRVGDLGTVLSLPGCADQTIHADTPHLFVHTQLPPHYLNLFMPACERDLPNSSGEKEGYDMGHTAFVVGSHCLDVAQRIMAGDGGEEELRARLIRPQLQAGDAFIFDCRVLHFGLCNRAQASREIASSLSADGSERTLTFDDTHWRPMMYVNYHQNFFHDPKNWNDKERLL